MDDEGGDWFGGGDDEPAVEESKPAAAAAAAAGGAPAEGAAPGEAAAEGGASAEGAAEDKREEAEDEYLDPDKLILFKHWIRPKFLQYQYLYNYRYNYYDNVLDYLEKRGKGYRRPIPRPETWAERILRTNRKESNRIETFNKSLEDTKLVTRSSISGYEYRYRNATSFNKRFSLLVY